MKKSQKEKDTLDVVENYFNTVIKKLWSWEKLTEERKRFVNMENIFNKIEGKRKVKEKWINTIYKAFLYGLGYDGWNWRQLEDTLKF